MSLSNDIVLRPRFKIEVPKDINTIFNNFDTAKTSQSNFILNRVEEHIFIRFPKAQQQFWSPQLHLEIDEINKNTCTIKGVFGPNPNVWTFFMFLHFLIAGLFIAFSIKAYTSWTLKQSFILPSCFSLVMVILWAVLYFAGRYGKSTSIDDMRLLSDFMYSVIEK